MMTLDQVSAFDDRCCLEQQVKYDLVVCAHTLLELPSAELRLQTALSLWRRTSGHLVFVEHGSKAGHEVLAEVRDFLLSLAGDQGQPELGGHVFAPVRVALWANQARSSLEKKTKHRQLVSE